MKIKEIDWLGISFCAILSSFAMILLAFAVGFTYAAITGENLVPICVMDISCSLAIVAVIIAIGCAMIHFVTKGR